MISLQSAETALLSMKVNGWKVEENSMLMVQIRQSCMDRRSLFCFLVPPIYHLLLTVVDNNQ